MDSGRGGGGGGADRFGYAPATCSSMNSAECPCMYNIHALRNHFGYSGDYLSFHSATCELMWYVWNGAPSGFVIMFSGF